MREIKSAFAMLGSLAGALLLATPAAAVEAICPGGSNPDPNVFFCDDFESGNLSAWNGYKSPNAGIVSSPVFSGNHAARFSYYLPPGEPAHRDHNVMISYDCDSSGSACDDVHHFFVRGHVYLASTAAPTSQRKLYYFFSKDWWLPDGQPNYGDQWDIVVAAWGLDTIRLIFGSNYYDYSDIKVPTYATKTLTYDRWYEIELEVKLNTPGLKDGEVRLWQDGELVAEKTAVSIRNNSKPIGKIRIGYQINRTPPDIEEKLEDRYWDNVVASKTRIGSMGSTDQMPPAAPTNLTVQ